VPGPRPLSTASRPPGIVIAAADAWPALPHPTPPLEGEVRVWVGRLDLDPESVEPLAGLLAADEHERAARFRFRRDAIRFVVCRAALRTILGECLGVAPQQVRLGRGPRGKPELAAPFDRVGLQFSLSRSESIGLCAVSRPGRVGVDIERLRPLPDRDAIAERTFSPRERQALRQLPPALRLEGFFNCWTRKEAYVKATGEGMSRPLERFTVSLTPGAPARLEEVEGDPAEAGRWTLEALRPEPGYVAALAVEGRPSRISRVTWRQRGGPPGPVGRPGAVAPTSIRARG
jgi:4'-phosphopantetheinyl transferase